MTNRRSFKVDLAILGLGATALVVANFISLRQKRNVIETTNEHIRKCFGTLQINVNPVMTDPDAAATMIKIDKILEKYDRTDQEH